MTRVVSPSMMTEAEKDRALVDAVRECLGLKPLHRAECKSSYADETYTADTAYDPPEDNCTAKPMSRRWF